MVNRNTASARRTAARVGASRRGAREQRLTIVGWFADQLSDLAELATRIQFPATRYQRDPCAFAREILGVALTPKQAEILDAVAHHKKVAVKSGRRVGKSFLEAVIALWFYCCFPDARVLATAPTARQINDIWWTEVRRLKAGSGICLACRDADPELEVTPRPCPHSAVIPGEPAEIAATGLRSDDFRKISGATAKKAEAFQGTSGRALLFEVDEASGVREDIYHAIMGNRAGGARLVLFGNPTQTRGEFFDAFHSKRHLYKTFSISSLESPNVVAGRIVVPGLADPEWIEEQKDAWGEDSALYKVHVLGEFALQEEGRIFGIERIAESERLWHELKALDDEASRVGAARERLYIGLDPAGETGMGDDSAFALRRGLWIMGVQRKKGLSAEGHIAHLKDLARAYAVPREIPVVVFDASGSIGAELTGTLAAYVTAEKRAGRRPPFELVPIYASHKAQREPQTYDRVRDELTAVLDRWMRAGGGIPEDARLEAELNEQEWSQRAGDGKVKVTPKDEIKRRLGRSPDSYDAVALSCWEPLELRVSTELAGQIQAAAQRPAPSAQRRPKSSGINPYASRDRWRR